VENIEAVEALVLLSQEDMPQTHRTQRQIVREIGIRQNSVNRIIKQDLRLKCFKKQKAQELTQANKQARHERSQQLLKQYPASLVNFIVFTDEKYLLLLLLATARTIVFMQQLGHERRTYQVIVCCAPKQPLPSR